LSISLPTASPITSLYRHSGNAWQNTSIIQQYSQNNIVAGAFSDDRAD
jgi:hypothetical protein